MLKLDAKLSINDEAFMIIADGFRSHDHNDLSRGVVVSMEKIYRAIYRVNNGSEETGWYYALEKEDVTRQVASLFDGSHVQIISVIVEDDECSLNTFALGGAYNYFKHKPLAIGI